jgi:cleavage and polyadenylation specificity factor subunit 3
MAPEDLREYAGLTTTTILCRQRLHLAAAGVELIRWALEGTFGTVTVVSDDRVNGIVNDTKKEEEEEADEEIRREGETKFEVMGGAVRLTHHPNGEVEIEWEGNAANDGIADAVMAVLLTIESSPAAVKQSSKMHNHSHEQPRKSMDYDAFGDSPVATRAPNGAFEKALATPEEALGKNPFANVDPAEKLNRLFMFLEAQFGEDAISPIARPKSPATNGVAETNGSTEASNATSNATSGEGSSNSQQERAAAAELDRLHALGIPVPGVEIKVDSKVAKVWLEELEVECANKILKERVGRVVQRAMETVAPLWQ